MLVGQHIKLSIGTPMSSTKHFLLVAFYACTIPELSQLAYNWQADKPQVSRLWENLIQHKDKKVGQH